MNNLFKGLLAGWGASKIGGGCLGTILAFAVIWWLLGTCDGSNQRAGIQEKKSIQQEQTARRRGDASHQPVLVKL
ncbi:MAG: hypothetical protein HOP08_15105 [Cyclobacteriaceae bacterium]|nr:hypothetical protein [Cyclobacteriaceae bacterium]